MEEIGTTNVDGYFDFLDSLTLKNKLDLISKLTESVKIDLSNNVPSFENEFSAFDVKESLKKSIEKIRNSRVSTRKTEPF